MKRLHFALLSMTLILATQPLIAATYYVGTCKSGSFATISAAVASVPAGSTVDVCPGGYYEQVTISKPLTLQGVTSGNSSQVIIAVPTSGLASTSSLFLGTVAAQINVTAESVNIANIQLIGEQSQCPNEDFVGIFYSSGSSGTLNNVEDYADACNNYATGILVENGAGPNRSVTIENSNIQYTSEFGIAAFSNQTPPTLTATIKNNYVTSSYDGIFVFGTDGSVANNNISVYGVDTVGNAGVTTFSASSPVTTNTISGFYNYAIDVEQPDEVSGNNINVTGPTVGIYVDSPGAKVTSNRIFTMVGTGIDLNAAGATIQSNTLNTGNIAIEFNCNMNTVTGNIITGAGGGIDAPAAFDGVNTFRNVGTNRIDASGC
jgi:hypothetical protein